MHGLMPYDRDTEPFYVSYWENDGGGQWEEKHEPFSTYTDATKFKRTLNGLKYIRSVVVEKRSSRYCGTIYLDTEVELPSTTSTKII